MNCPLCNCIKDKLTYDSFECTDCNITYNKNGIYSIWKKDIVISFILYETWTLGNPSKESTYYIIISGSKNMRYQIDIDYKKMTNKERYDYLINAYENLCFD